MMLRHVHEMASEAGVQAMICEAEYRSQNIADQLATIDGHHAKALWALINHGPAFHTARRLLAAASPVGRFWNLTTGFSGQTYDVSPPALAALRGAVAGLYREQGRGHNCSVEPYERDGVLYLFLYLDDYTQTHTAHDLRGKLTRSPLRPAFEVVYVYTRVAGTLDMYARGDRRWRSELRDRFCGLILRTTAPFRTPERRSYQLNGLIDRSFPLDTDPVRGILSAAVRRLRIVHVNDLARRVTLGNHLEPAAGRVRHARRPLPGRAVPAVGTVGQSGHVHRAARPGRRGPAAPAHVRRVVPGRVQPEEPLARSARGRGVVPAAVGDSERGRRRGGFRRWG